MDVQALAASIDAPLIITEWLGSPGCVLAATQHAQAFMRPDYIDRPLDEVLMLHKGALQPGATSECTMCGANNTLVVRWRCDCRLWAPLAEGEAFLLINLSDVGVRETPSSPSDADFDARRTPTLAPEIEGDHEEQGFPSIGEVTIEKLRILLVEDDSFCRRAVQELCRLCEFDVTESTSGEECLQILEQNARLPPRERINLVMCDVMMHGMNGHEVLMQIRRRHGHDMAVIMISSNDQHQMVESCIREGADSYIIKPLRMSDFKSIWQFVMQQSIRKLRHKQQRLQARQRELNFVRLKHEAEIMRMTAEKRQAEAMAEAEREKAQRERAEALSELQRVEQEAKLDRQREAMQKQIMRLLHQQVRKYWLLAKMCNDVVVHASSDGFFIYLSPECKAKLGYTPHELSEAKLLGCVHPVDLQEMRRLVNAEEPAKAPAGQPTCHTVSLRIRTKGGAYVELEMPMHPVLDSAKGGASSKSMIGALPRLHPAMPRDEDLSSDAGSFRSATGSVSGSAGQGGDGAAAPPTQAAVVHVSTVEVKVQAVSSEKDGYILSAAAALLCPPNSTRAEDSCGVELASAQAATECAAHPACVVLGLEGECCPVGGGGYACCGGSDASSGGRQLQSAAAPQSTIVVRSSYAALDAQTSAMQNDAAAFSSNMASALKGAGLPGATVTLVGTEQSLQVRVWVIVPEEDANSGAVGTTSLAAVQHAFQSASPVESAMSEWLSNATVVVSQPLRVAVSFRQSSNSGAVDAVTVALCAIAGAIVLVAVAIFFCSSLRAQSGYGEDSVERSKKISVVRHEGQWGGGGTPGNPRNNPTALSSIKRLSKGSCTPNFNTLTVESEPMRYGRVSDTI
mmetsp:Transcript_61066/g.167493  ORF Transcript_61066/g.167493 Transcript_61066/m.167493 type:complete len:854 (+) Transcript_61066:30-2591(+)